MGLLSGMLDAIHGEDERIGGIAVTELTTPLFEAELGTINVVSTLGFGEFTDGTGDAKLIIGGEVIQATGRTGTTFTGLTRGIGPTKIQALHPQTTIVYDFAHNQSAIDRLTRGFFVNFAIGSDLDTIGRNLGVIKCLGLSEEQWREIIKRTAYLRKTPIDAFRKVLDAVFPGLYEIQRLPSEPYTVRVRIGFTLATDLKGKLFLNGGEEQLTTGLTSVDTTHGINQVLGVYLDTPVTRLGYREGFTNFFTAGSFLGNTITLGSSPGAIGTPVLVDYGAFAAHYTAADETIVDDGDFYGYLEDDAGLALCLLKHVKAGGVRVIVEQA